MVTATDSIDTLRRQWRRQVLAHRGPRSVAARKGFVALTFIDQANMPARFVDIRNLLVVLLYEDEFRNNGVAQPGRTPLRLSAYRVSRVPHGVQWGGANNSVLFKDLMLAPQHNARGQRIDQSKVGLLSLAIKLNRQLTRAALRPAAPWRRLRLPRLWAGFRPGDARALHGEGPEFEQACCREHVTTTTCFRQSARCMDGLTLYPLDWVSEQLELATGVFAEMTPSWRPRIYRIERIPDDLMGYKGASEFDFYSSPFRRLPHAVG